MFEKLPMPVWLRDSTGEPYWANQAYADAVDRTDGEAAVRDHMQLLDSAERRQVAGDQREQGYFQGTLPAVVAGDRRMLDICEVKTDAGFAGIAIDRSEIEAVRATLRQTVESHRQTLDYLTTPIAMFDKRQHLQFYNSSFAKMWGLGEAFLSGRPSNAQVLDAFREEHKLPERPDWRKWCDSQLEVYQAVEPRQEFWHLSDGQHDPCRRQSTYRRAAQPGCSRTHRGMALESNYKALMQVQGETLDHLSRGGGRVRLRTDG